MDGDDVIDVECESTEIQTYREGPVDSRARAEIATLASVARKNPRSIAVAIREAIKVACTTRETAESCHYSLPRGGKLLEGPSVRLAEIMVYAMGSIQATTSVVEENDRFVVAQARALDLERGNAVAVEVRRKITDRTGRKFADDMVVVTANAAMSIAYRNAIFRLIPRALVDPVYQETLRVARGDGTPLAERRAALLEWAKSIRVTTAELCKALAVGGVEDIGETHLETVSGLRTSIKTGETTVEDVFRPSEDKPKVKALAEKLAERGLK